MKYLLLVCIFCFSSSSVINAQNFFKKASLDLTEAIPDTIVAYYPFNGDAADSSGFGNDGVVVGAQLTEDRFGNPNSAYEFDGIDDYINLGDGPSLNITGDLTLSVWAKGVSSSDVITALIGKTTFEQGNGGGIGPYGLGVDNVDQLYFYVRNSEENLPLLIQNVEIDPEKWNHYLGVFKTGEFLKFYKNGNLIGSIEENVPTRIDSSSRPLIIGARSNSSNQNLVYYFDGSIDDIRVYNKAIEDSTVFQLYTERGWPLQEDSTEVIQDTLVAHYPFSGSAVDSSGFGNDGVVVDAQLTEDRFGNTNSAYEFDGNNDYIEIAHESVFNSSARSVEFWFKKTNNTIRFNNTEFFVEGLIWKSFDTSLNRDYSFSISNQNAPFDVYNTIGNNTSNLLQSRVQNIIRPNKWYHIVGIIDTSKVLTYLNGSLISSVENNGDVVFSSAPIVIGKASSNSLQTRYFEGVIDDIKLFNYEVDSVYVLDSYSQGGWPIAPNIDSTGVIADTLVAHYKFEGNAADSSGFGNDGVVAGATLSADRFGNLNQAYVFDGDDYINFGSSDSIEFGKEDFSFSLWVRPVFDNKSQYRILQKGNDHSIQNEASWAIELIEDGRLRLHLKDAENEIDALVVTSENAYLDNSWHHIVGVFDRDSTLRVYVDNKIELETQEIKNFQGNITNLYPYNLYAGRDNTGNPEKGYTGSIDDIRIYSYALGEGAIQQLFEGDDNITVSNSDEIDEIPVAFNLYQNYPNPFNPSTLIKYSIEKSGFVELKVYDIAGRLITKLVNENKNSGNHFVRFNASNLASGVYIYELKSNGNRAIKKFTLIK